MSDWCRIRPATEAEVRAERLANPTGLWIQVALDLDERTVARAARRLWGPPVRSGSEGEWLWRLWDDDLGIPVYIAIGLLPPAVLLSGGMMPGEGEDERLRDVVRGMLLGTAG